MGKKSLTSPILGIGGGGKKSANTPTPDYKGAAEQTAASNQAAVDAQTQANRPNQSTAFGSSNWTKDANGNWTQALSMNPADQAHLDANRGIASDLTSQIAGQQPLSMEGAPEMTGYDTSNMVKPDYSNLGGGQFHMDPTGNSQAIQDATYKLLQPQRELQRQSEIQRLKNQGLSENSEAFQRGMTRLDQGDTEAQLRSLLAGQAEYGNQFNRGLQENQSNFGQNSNTQQLIQALRGQQFGEQGAAANLSRAQRAQILNERSAVNQAPYSNLLQLLATNPTNPIMPGVPMSGNAGGTDYAGALKDLFNTQQGATNADNARSANQTSGLVGLASAAATFF